MNPKLSNNHVENLGLSTLTQGASPLSPLKHDPEYWMKKSAGSKGEKVWIDVLPLLKGEDIHQHHNLARIEDSLLHRPVTCTTET